MSIVDFEQEIQNNIKNYKIPRNIRELDEKTFVEQLDAYYNSLYYLKDFVSKVILKIKQLSLNEREEIANEIFLRMYILIQSIIKLNDIKDFQTIASIARTSFELYIDLILMIEGLIENDIIKYNFYNNVATLNYAQKICSYYKKKPNIERDISFQKDFLNKNKNPIEIKIIEYWCAKRNKKGVLQYPKHWSGLDTRKRSILIDQKSTKFNKIEELYVEIFPRLSWYIHSDPTAVVNISEQMIDIGIMHSYVHIYDIFSSSCLEYGEFCHVDKAFQNFNVFRRNLKFAPMHFRIRKYLDKNSNSKTT